MQRENKWQERFDEKFRETLSIVESDMIKHFIQSELDTAIAEERKKVVKQWKKANKHRDGSPDGMNVMWAYFDDFINLITKQQ